MQAQFLDGKAGRVFTLLFPALREARGNIVFCPAFGEEVNRTRHLVAEQARRFCSNGYNCLLLDYYGTGDSEGVLNDAKWDVWCSDIELVARWLADKFDDLPLTLWGMRLGCLLGAEVLSRDTLKPDGILFWQPVLDGKKYSTELLRQRMAHIVERGLPKKSSEQLRELWAQGQAIEIGGYPVAAHFAEQLESKRIGDTIRFTGKSVYWVQQEGPAGPALPLAGQKVADTITQMDNSVSVLFYQGPALWQLHERVDSGSLLTQTNSFGPFL
jgi:exosortase A-associated hydrolase 2